MEISVRVRASTASITPSSGATADTLIIHQMPSLGNGILSLPTIDARYALWRNDPLLYRDEEMNFLMSAAEYKLYIEDTAYKQLVYDLSTAQSARRALALADVTLYGWTSHKTPPRSIHMALHACWWMRPSLSSLNFSHSNLHQVGDKIQISRAIKSFPNPFFVS